MAWQEFIGKSVREAIEEACRDLQVDEALLEIRVIRESTRGFLGIVGQRDAVVRVRKRDIMKEVMEADAPKADAPKADTREPDAPRVEAPKADAPRSEAPKAKPKPPRRRSRDTKAPPRTRRPRPAEPPAKRDRPPKDPEPEMDREDRESGARPEESPQLADARIVLEGILQRMSIKTEVKSEIMDGAAYLDIRGDGSGLLIGKDGRTLDALEFIVNKIVNKPRRHPSKIEVIVDTEKYRLRKREQFREDTLRKSRQAKKSLKPVSFKPMPAKQRRLVHMILEGDREIYTKSIGEGPRRHIVIYPRRGMAGKRRRR